MNEMNKMDGICEGGIKYIFEYTLNAYQLTEPIIYLV